MSRCFCLIQLSKQTHNNVAGLSRYLISLVLFVLTALSPSLLAAEWELIYSQDFGSISLPIEVNWYADQETDNHLPLPCFVPPPSICAPAKLSDDQLPRAYRFSLPLGHHEGQNALTIESYTRDQHRQFSDLVHVISDPSDPDNLVLKLRSVDHTDATILRSSLPLEGDYQIRLRLGYMKFGTGQGVNGYDGDEQATPWFDQSALDENGFYWLAIADQKPTPQSNLWWHHHRKFVIDSDNTTGDWMQIWNGNGFEKSGQHPIMVFTLDGKGKTELATGKPFISYAADHWQDSGLIRAIDAYKSDEWYELVFTRQKNTITISLSGNFRFAGEKTYSAEISLADNCVWHYPRNVKEAETVLSDCLSFPEQVWENYASWLPGDFWPDYFFLGDPHTNYYEGSLLIDDVKIFGLTQ